MASLIVLSYNVFANKQRLSIESLFIFVHSFEIGGSVCRVITIKFKKGGQLNTRVTPIL